MEARQSDLAFLISAEESTQGDFVLLYLLKRKTFSTKVGKGWLA